MNPSSFRVNGRNAEEEAMMADALRAVFGQGAAVHRGAIGTPLGEEVPGGLSEVRALIKEGDKALTRRNYWGAEEKFQKALALLAAKDDSKTKIPLDPLDGGGVRSESYTKMDFHQRIVLQSCCRGLASALAGLGRDEEALNWFEEVRVINWNMQFASAPLFDWLERSPLFPDYFRERVLGHAFSSDVFLKLGNTGSAVHRKWHAQTAISMSHAASIRNDELVKMADPSSATTLCKYRHPDPQLVSKLERKNERLQVRGSWKKIELKKSVKITQRMGFGSFVWQSRFYVLGGEKALEGPHYRDFWFIDLEKLEDGWHSLPGYPRSTEDVEAVSGFHMSVHKDKAYLFTGFPSPDVFDLRTETWSQLRVTTEQPSRLTGEKWWPAWKGIRDYSMCMADGKMYVFGGTHDLTALGCNQFTVLDVETGVWRLLSGDMLPTKASWDIPGPRRFSALWHDGGEDGGRLWLLYGEADRLGARLAEEEQGASSGYGYDDFWSWSVKDEVWRRERFVGNPPSPRSEMGCTYNTKLGFGVIFGGYHPTQPTNSIEAKNVFRFTYFADTFIHTPDPANPAKRMWKHALTRGFPTYRAQPALFTDPATGRMFSFGGYTNSEFVPDGKHNVSRAFGDLWELRLDVPGGHFDGVDLEEEARTARAGPWQRCFSCGSAGPWKKCGGTCRGRAFFCDSDCLKEGWREHKQRHHCMKK